MSRRHGNSSNSISLLVLLVLMSASLAVAKNVTAAVGPAHTPFYAKGTSGKQVLINKTWDGGCSRLPDGVWQHSERTLTGHVLDWIWTDYENGSATPDCTHGRVGVTHALQTFTEDHTFVPITWVDAKGKKASPPPGLTSVTKAIGLTARVRFATVTPKTKKRAHELNRQKWCGITDWTARVTHDILNCYTSGFGHKPFKATIVVDDTTTPNRLIIYDGTGDVRHYPTRMPNYFSHHRDLS